MHSECSMKFLSVCVFVCENAHAPAHTHARTHTMPFLLWIIAKKFEIAALKEEVWEAHTQLPRCTLGL